ncbi:hypothetical protein WJX81_005394 [Elliptochloris bilobata]|uniref:Sigma-54 factor interaction domain-containing protein n=1 Tax=Elliptochloris bilobata TaxID=381761 RepID=A0AAW1RT97_9CHLO
MIGLKTALCALAIDGSDGDGSYADIERRLAASEAALQAERERDAALQPYLVSAPKCGVVGTSKYADRLRRQVVAASRDPARKPVLIFGEPGLEKCNLAALVHFGSPAHAAPLIQVACDRIGGGAPELFGRGSKRGLLEFLPKGSTVVLNNAHAAPADVQALFAQLCRDGTYAPGPSSAALAPPRPQPAPRTSVGRALRSGDPAARAILADAAARNARQGAGPSVGSAHRGALRRALARVILVAERPLPALDSLAIVIKVPPLRVRPKDIAAMQAYFLRERERRMGSFTARRGGPRLALTPAALRHIESYAFPGNIAELRDLVERAAVQAGEAAPQLNADLFWFATQASDRWRINLLSRLPLLRAFLRSKLWPERINFSFTVYAFAAINAILLLGPQDRGHNFALNAFWCYWWPLSFLVYPFLGRIWCSVCPFMIYGELVQRWRLSKGVKLLKWPHVVGEKYGAWFLYALFAAILVWEQCWDLEQTAYLSSCLLLLITAGAMLFSWFFERRYWCRYLCPIGGMNGLFAKLSMTELRARQGVCGATCSTYHCYRGGPAEPPEGQETNGCPLHSHPAQLVDNRDCACPHSSVEVRLRPPAIDLWSTHTPLPAEAALLFLLLGAVYLHHLPQLCDQLGIGGEAITGPLPVHMAASVAVLGAPGLFAWALDAAGRWAPVLTLPWKTLPVPSAAGVCAGVGASAIAAVGGGASAGSGRVRGPGAGFVEMAYGYTPLVWAGTLSHYLLLLCEEAGRILPVMGTTVGLKAEATRDWPVLVADHHGGTLLAGAALSLLLTRKLAARPWAVLLPQVAGIAAFTAELWYLIV